MARRKSPAALTAANTALVGAREHLFELAGFDALEQATLTRRIIDKLSKLMEAQKVQRLVVNNGLHSSEVQEFIDEDGALQARAAGDLVDILGIQPSKSGGSGSQAPPIQVAISFVQRPKMGK